MPESPTEIYTDGACSGNPGPGGWGWVSPDGREGNGAELHTTNQRMEIQAVLEALRAVPGPVNIVSDSTYVVKCFNDRWYEGWLKRGWKNSQKKPVANQDLWEPLIELYLERQDEIQFTWVKGHSGNAFNDKADELAVQAKEELMISEGIPLSSRSTNSAAKKTASVGALPPDAAAGATQKIAGDAVEVLDPDASEAPWPIGPALLFVGTTSPSPDDEQAIAAAVAGLDPEHAIVVSGLRRGTELVAAEAALERQIALAVVLPFADPAGRWPDPDRQRFDAAFAAAQYDITLPGNPSQPGSALRARNAWFEQAALGAVVVGDADLADHLEAVGQTVVRI